MKKTTAILTALLVMAVLFASCSNGMGEKAEGSGSGSSTQAVKVSLSLGGEVANIAQRAVALTGVVDASTFEYYYQATPNWKKADGTPANAQGKTNGFVAIPYPGSGHNYEDNFSLGYFTPGNWTFEVEVRLPANQGGTVLYVGSNPSVVINNALKELTINMSLKNEDEQGASLTGTVNVAVAVPYLGEGTTVTMTKNGTPVALTIYDDESGNPNSKDYTVTSTSNKTPLAQNGWRLFRLVDESFAPGDYTILLQYKDVVNAVDKVVGGAAVAFTVVNGGDYLICGTIENGKYQIVELTLNGIDAVDLSMVTDPYDDQHDQNITTIGQDGSLKFTVTDRWSETHAGTYTWYVNGVETDSANNQDEDYEFTLDTSIPGVYEVSCTVDKTVAIGSVSETVTVTPAKIINIISKVDKDGDGTGDGKNIKAAYTGQSIVCTPVGAGFEDNDVDSVEWIVTRMDVQPPTTQSQSAVINAQTNVFTFCTTSTTNTNTAGTYKIVCKTYDDAQTPNLIGYGEKTITLTAPPQPQNP
jgi:hypothetical protein